MDTDRYTVDPSVRALLADLGVSLSDVLRRAGLPSDLFSRGQASLPADEYHALWRAVEEEYAGGPSPSRSPGRSPSRCPTRRSSPRCAAPTSASRPAGSRRTSG